jgi:hypothetical protein
MIKPSAWNEEEIQYLKENYLKQHAKEIGLTLGRSYASVVNQLYQQRLSTTGRKLKAINLRTKGSRYQKLEACKLPVFHPVMVGLHPVTNRNGSNSIWRKRRAIVLKMHDYCCAYCGDDANTVDHIIPSSRGGTDDLMNLVAACDLCNYGFRDRDKHVQFKISVI